MLEYEARGFAAYCRRLMAETTAEFQAVNEGIRALEARLAGRLNRPDLAALLRTVQGGERDVLRFTLVLQARAPPTPKSMTRACPCLNCKRPCCALQRCRCALCVLRTLRLFAHSAAEWRAARHALLPGRQEKAPAHALE